MAAKGPFPYKVLNDLTAKLKAAQVEAESAKAEIRFLKGVKTSPISLDNQQVEDLTRKEAELMLLNTTLGDKVEYLSKEREELQQQNTSINAQVKHLSSKLSNLTNENNRYHLRLAMASCEDLMAIPTSGSASPSSPWSPVCPSTPWPPAPACTSSPGPTTGTPWSPSTPSCGRTRSQLSSVRNISPTSPPVPLMSLKLEMFTNVPFYTDMHDEAPSAQESLDTNLVVEDPAPETVKDHSEAHSWDNDEWSNISTVVPYTAVSSTTPTSRPAPALQKNAKANSWISKLVRTVDRLARKYSIPVEKRKSKAYMRKVKTSPIRLG